MIQGYHLYQVSEQKKVTTDRIRAHLLRADDNNNAKCSVEKLESMLTDLIDQNIIELITHTKLNRHKGIL